MSLRGFRVIAPAGNTTLRGMQRWQAGGNVVDMIERRFEPQTFRSETNTSTNLSVWF